MLRRLLGWTRWSPPARPAARATAAEPPRPTTPPPERASPTPPTPSAVLAVPDRPAVDVEAAALATLARRASELLRDLAADAADGAGGDAALLVASLRDAGSDGIRQPPTEAQRALAVSRDPGCTFADLRRLAESSPALTQALLRTANSARYGTAGVVCSSIPDAVRRLGAAGVESVALSAMVQGLLCRPGAAYLPLLEQVWTHMVRTAPLARAIAPAFAVAPSEAFALGLLHDAGKLVIFDRISALRHARRRDLVVPYPVLARVLAALHEPLGALTIHRWGLGALAAQAIGAHHAEAPLDDAAADHLRQLLYVAERADLAALRGEPPALDAWWARGALTAPLPAAAELLAGYVPEE